MKEKISITIDKHILKNIDSFIDRIFIRNRSQAIENLLKSYLDKSKSVVILLGGPEERLKIGKKYTPLVNIKGVTLIERTMIKLRKDNFKEIYIIARKKILDEIFSLLKSGEYYGVKIKYIEEQESNGSAQSLRLIKKEISNTFLLLYGDIYFDNLKLNDLWNFHIKNNVISSLSLITFGKPSIKGQVFLEGDKIVQFNQKPKGDKENSYLVWCPICVCEPEILQYPGKSLEEDIFPVLAKKNLLKGYINSEREIHIHTQEDLDNINKNSKIK